MDEGPNYILSSGETNIIPANKWAFGQYTRFVRINEKPFPYCYAWESDCHPYDHCCDWWKEKYHRAMAWAMTKISIRLIKAKQDIPAVGDYDHPGAISVQAYTANYIVPLCNLLDSFNKMISKPHLRDRFSRFNSSAQCKGDNSRCDDGYYSMEYWEGLDVLACATLQSVLSDLDDHMIELNIEKQKNKSAAQLYNSLVGIKQKSAIKKGTHEQWQDVFKAQGGQTEFQGTKQEEGFAGFGPTEGETPDEKSPLDALLEKALTDKQTVKGIDTNLILLGAGALALVLLTTKKKPKD